MLCPGRPDSERRRSVWRLRLALVSGAALLAAAGVVALMAVHRDAVHRSVLAKLQENGPIYFLGTAESGPSSLYAIDPDGTNLKHISLWGYPGSIAVSPDAALVALSNGDGGEFSPRNIYVMKVDGTQRRRITTVPEVDFRLRSLQEDGPAWAPGGTHIVFASNRCCDGHSTMERYGLYVVRPDGSGLRALTNVVASDMYPAWSPDATRIAFIRSESAFRSEIWMMDVDGSDPRPVVRNNRQNIAVAWSPDARHLAYATVIDQNEDWQLRVVRADGTGDHLIFSCTDVCNSGGRALGWSPDGQEIAFVILRTRGREIVLQIAFVSPDGNDFRILDSHGVQPTDLTWTPAG